MTDMMRADLAGLVIATAFVLVLGGAGWLADRLGWFGKDGEN